MTHLDLFSGIGGFALAADRVWENVEHIFVEIDPFCQRVLTKHWPEARIYGDIRTVTNTNEVRLLERKSEVHTAKWNETQSRFTKCDLLTGGFPCQPFSQAGKRNGTADNRYLWPEMLRVISEFKPTWVIAENVRGLLTWNEGLVFEQVCTDLEAQGYEVQPFVIPACSVNAPHRRDRVWFIANRKSGWEWGSQSERDRQGQSEASHRDRDWDENWLKVATELCRMDDGISPGLDESGYSKAGHRRERLKALGNAIVPQVAEQIMRGMV